MMGTKHKHAELIKAWADGAEIEYNNGGEWVLTDPAWNELTEYRIKPEPKPDIVRYMQVCFFSINNTKGCNTSNHTDWQGENDNVKITFDGETNELKSLEIIK